MKASRSLLEGALHLVVNLGADPNDTEDLRLQKSSLVLGSLMFIFAGALWGIMYFLLGRTLAGLFPFSYVVISLLSVVGFRFTRRFQLFLFGQLLLTLFLPFLLMIALGGFLKSSGVILWSLISPLVALLFHEPHRALRWLVAYLGLVVLSGFLEFRPLVLTSH